MILNWKTRSLKRNVKGDEMIVKIFRQKADKAGAGINQWLKDRGDRISIKFIKQCATPENLIITTIWFENKATKA